MIGYSRVPIRFAEGEVGRSIGVPGTRIARKGYGRVEEKKSQKNLRGRNQANQRIDNRRGRIRYK